MDDDDCKAMMVGARGGAYGDTTCLCGRCWKVKMWEAAGLVGRDGHDGGGCVGWVGEGEVGDYKGLAAAELGCWNL